MRHTWTIVILFSTLSAYGQNRINLTYFTLGLVDDYLGRSLIKDDTLDITKIDLFHETESDIMDYLDSLIIVENSSRDRDNQIDKRRVRRQERNCINCHEFFIYYSKSLADDVNSKYNFKFAKSWDNKGRKMYYGLLKKSIMKTDKQRISFLTGAYLKFGTHDGDLYKYHQANSPRKYDVIIKTLKEMGCEIIGNNVNQNSIPASQTIEFRPTQDLKERFDKLEFLKMEVESKRTAFLSMQ